MSSVCQSSVFGVIPARWGSSRFPGKPLHLIAGKSLIHRVIERVEKCQNLAKILVATDDERIAQAVEKLGVQAVMTRRDHATGSDRIVEVLEHLGGEAPKYVVNIQGDEPLIDPELVDRVAAGLLEEEEAPMVTAASPLTQHDLYEDPNVVKVVLTTQNRALYFSRAPLPFYRTDKAERPPIQAYRHIGLYGYQSAFLKEFVSLAPSSLEEAESLEQLRALEHGYPIHVLISEDGSPGIDTLEQALAMEKSLLQSVI